MSRGFVSAADRSNRRLLPVTGIYTHRADARSPRCPPLCSLVLFHGLLSSRSTYVIIGFIRRRQEASLQVAGPLALHLPRAEEEEEEKEEVVEDQMGGYQPSAREEHFPSCAQAHNNPHLILLLFAFTRRRPCALHA